MLKLLRLFLLPFMISLSILGIFFVSIFRPRNYKNGMLFLNVLEKLFVKIWGFRFEFEGEKLFEDSLPGIVIANHQSNWDLITIAPLFRYPMSVLGKRELFWIPVFGQLYWLADSIFINRGNKDSARKTLELTKQKLQSDNRGLLVFPEGHRNPKEELLPFKKGAYYLAIDMGIPLIPVSFSRYLETMDISKKESIVIKIKAHTPIQTSGLTKEDIPKLIETTRTLIQNGRK